MESLLSTLLLFGAFVGGGVGCTHTHRVHGPLPAHEMPNGISVGIGSREVKEGDSLVVYGADCSKSGRAPAKSECPMKELGTATVLKVLSEDKAVVGPKNGLVMDRSMNVKKQGG